MGPLREFADRHRGVSHAVIAALLLVVATTTAEAAFWYEDYAEAERALAEGDWTQAIQHLQSALSKKGEPSARVRTYGMNFRAYFPYYKLGIASQELGQFEKAEQAYEASERAGAIAESREDLAELRRRKADIQQAAAAAEQQRTAVIVTESLRNAADLEQQEQYETALAELENGFRVAPENPDLLLAQSRLQSLIRQREDAARTEEQFAQLVADGRTQMTNGRYSEAASAFGRALGLRDTVEARSLRDEAQGKLREQLQAEQDATERLATIANGIQQARADRASGNLLEALRALEPVLALEPDNREAGQLRLELQQAQALVEASNQRDSAVTGLMAEMQELFDAGNQPEAVTKAHLALALDPGNSEIQRLIVRAQRGLAPDIYADIPPDLEFVTQRELRESDNLEYAPRQVPDFELTGEIFDPSASVTLEVTRHPFSGRCPSRNADGSCDWRDAEAAALETPGLALAPRISAKGDRSFINFTIIDTLPAGYWLYSVRAVNKRPLTSLHTFIVRYQQPFLARRSVQATALGFVLLALVSVLLTAGNRTRRRRRRLKTQHNPYVAGLPAKGEQFFGREQLIQKIMGRIRNNSILLHGERRIGKTSIQHELKSRLEQIKDEECDYYPVYVTLEGTPQDLLFGTIARAIFEQLQSGLDGCKPNPKLESGGYDFWDFRRDFRAVFKALKQHSTKKAKIVLLVDEVDQLNEYESSVNSLLRSLFQDREADELVAVFSGVEINKTWRRRSSPWFNVFQSEPVEPFERADAEHLIRAPIRGLFSIEDGVVNKIIENADGKPYYIQRICTAIVDRLFEHKRRRMTLADVEAVGRPWGDIEE